MNKYCVSYIKNDVPQALIVEASNKEVAERFFVNDMPDAQVCGIDVARSDDMKPGMPVVKVPQMTHNEYQKFLADNAAKVHTDKNYSLKDYERDANMVDILGFELDKFNLNDAVKGFINKFFDKEDVNRLGHTVLRTHVIGDGMLFHIINNLNCNIAYDTGLSGFAKNDEFKCVLGFCEGDIDLVLCENDEVYKEEVASYNEFYGIENKEVCIEVYFDDTHIDNIYVHEDEVAATISFLVQHGYDNYNEEVKADWEKISAGKVPKMSFKVVDTDSLSLEETISNAEKKSKETEQNEAVLSDKEMDV